MDSNGTNKNIERFIHHFKKDYTKEMEYVFLHGQCYAMALILQSIFAYPIYFDPDTIHFYVSDGTYCYDILGKHSVFSVCLWEEWKDKHPYEAEQIEKGVYYG